MKIAVTSTSFSKNEVLAREIKRYFPDVRLNGTGERLEGERLASFIDDAEGLVVGLEKLDAHLLSECPNLKVIAKYGVGLDNIDLGFCRERGIAVGWTGGVNRLSVAELTLGFMLALCRNLYVTSNQLKNGTWNKSGGHQLSGRKVGIIGVGNIGREVVRLLEPFRCEVLANDIVDQRAYYLEKGLREATKEEIFAEAEIVSLHTPLTPDTEGLIDRGALSRMKRSAFLINTARGGIVRQDDLKWALQNGMIAGAAVDVYEEEPPTDTEFLGLPNLICTPHIGGNAYEAVIAMGMSAIGHLKDFFESGSVPIGPAS